MLDEAHGLSSKLIYEQILMVLFFKGGASAFGVYSSSCFGSPTNANDAECRKSPTSKTNACLSWLNDMVMA